MAKFVGGRDSGLLRAVEGLSELRLKGGEIHRFLANVIAGERCDEVVDGEAHDCRTE